jgi:hypothetical protein
MASNNLIQPIATLRLISSSAIKYMEDKIKTYIKEIQNTVTIAGLNYEVWWLFKERESRKKYVNTMNNYLMFFSTSIHAHFIAYMRTRRTQ